MVTTSIKEVARHAGVSVGTVSNVLNRPELVAEPTRQRVVASIDALGFVRNESARALRAGRSRTVGLVVLDVANPFFTDIARGAEDVADANDMVVTLCNSAEDLGRETRHLAHLEEQRVRGVLITPVDTGSTRLDQLVHRGIPLVLVDRGSPQADRCSVAVDDVLGGRLAVEHLVATGHQRIAFVGGPMSIPQVSDRLAGASGAVEGTPTDLLTIETSSLSVQGGRDAGEQLARLAVGRRPTGVFCANDLVALGLLQEMTRGGIQVPADVAIVGYDDIEYAAAAAVPLSSVRQPREQLGRAAAELLFDEINGSADHRHQHLVFEPDLVVRDSSRLPARATKR
ncbi:MAG: substrate-binding domain-containing protein [Propionibacteriales bacterium]|nr:substrate-binding domain-containing protein [Propionibacteriales bacterium]